MRSRAHFPILAGALLSVTPAHGADGIGTDHFENHVRPLLAEQCYVCHSGPTPQADLRVDSLAGLVKGGKRGPAIQPGDPEGSLMLQMVRSAEGLRMPPTGRLTEEQIGHMEEWIRMGAPFPEGPLEEAAAIAEKHWAFVSPAQPEAPRSANGWADGAIDRFVEERLHRERLQPSSPADPRTLVRRVHYDLTGLPPDPDESDAFAASPTEEAYEEIVDSLLSSDLFGQRWARHWLDLVRYSDEGFQARPFAIAWPYRDWVVDAFNSDIPYDRFVRLQLAADLMGADRAQLPALGMLALGINLPRPTDVPENVDDRIDVVTRGLLGLSVACARCHDHKFDPIPQKDYYALYGVFLNSPPTLEPVPLEQRGRGTHGEFFRAKLAERRAWLDRFREERLADHVSEFRKPETLARYLGAAWAAGDLGNREFEALAKERNLNHYLLNRWRTYLNGLVAPSLRAFADLDSPGGAERVAQAMARADSVYRWPDAEREALRLALRGNGSPTDIPLEDFWWIQSEGDSNVMKGLKWQYDGAMQDWSHRGGPKHAMVVGDARKLQPAYLFVRGNQHDKGDEVSRRFLSALPGPGEFRSGSGRLELATAIASERNPLTARVFVNRVWGHLFGEGLVRTPSNFGMRGDPPSHPELLDHLASQFMADGWSTKRLVKRIVLSKTYRQDSVDRASGLAADPSNRLLWRQNRTRLDFEAMRDSMLAVAGRLDTNTGGPPFELEAIPSSPRRTLYAYVSREEPSALMRIFDFSNPEEHTPRRQLTTVPQQALFLMNSSFLSEQARALAASCEASEDCVSTIHRRVLGRLPEPSARRAALAFIASRAEGAPPGTTATEPDGPWQHGTGKLDIESGKLLDFRPMKYHAGDRVQPAPMFPAPESGRASLTPRGGSPGDDTEWTVVRRWTAPRSMRIAIEGALNHPMGDQALRFGHSNGVRGWIISSERGVLSTWKVWGYEADTGIRNLKVERGEHFDFAVDALGDYEADGFRWSPEISEILDAEQRQAGMEPQAWTAEEGFPEYREEPLTPLEQYAQVLLMTNEFSFRD